MICMPVKTKKEDSAISPVFGKVKYLAVVTDNGTVNVIENTFGGGGGIVEFMLRSGVKTVIAKHIGPIGRVLDFGIEVYYSGEERLTIPDAIKKLKNGELIKIDRTNTHLMASSHSHDHSHGHAH